MNIVMGFGWLWLTVVTSAHCPQEIAKAHPDDFGRRALAFAEAGIDNQGCRDAARRSWIRAHGDTDNQELRLKYLLDQAKAVIKWCKRSCRSVVREEAISALQVVEREIHEEEIKELARSLRSQLTLPAATTVPRPEPKLIRRAKKAFDERRFAEALALFRRFEAISQARREQFYASVDLYWRIGICLEMLGRYEEAIPVLEAHLRLTKDNHAGASEKLNIVRTHGALLVNCAPKTLRLTINGEPATCNFVHRARKPGKYTVEGFTKEGSRTKWEGEVIAGRLTNAVMIPIGERPGRDGADWPMVLGVAGASTALIGAGFALTGRYRYKEASELERISANAVEHNALLNEGDLWIDWGIGLASAGLIAMVGGLVWNELDAPDFAVAPTTEGVSFLVRW